MLFFFFDRGIDKISAQLKKEATFSFCEQIKISKPDKCVQKGCSSGIFFYFKEK